MITEKTLLSSLNIEHSLSVPYLDLFSAVTSNFACKSLSKERIFNKLKDYTFDIEGNKFDNCILDIIGMILEDVRILLIDDESETIYGGGCQMNKCKTRIVLLQLNEVFYNIEMKNRDKYCLDKLLKRGKYVHTRTRKMQMCAVFFAVGLMVMLFHTLNVYTLLDLSKIANPQEVMRNVSTLFKLEEV